MTTYEDAYTVRTQLGMIFFPHPGLTGIGLRRDEHGSWSVEVNLRDNTLVGTIPTEVEGVKVTCQVLGDVSAY